MRQAQIKDGIIHADWLGSGPAPVPPDASWTFIDVTNRPEAIVGGRYNARTDTFEPPTHPKVLSYNEFIQLLTASERKALRALARTNEDAADVLDLMRTASSIPLASPRTAQLLQQLVGLNILTESRQLEILSST